MYMVHHIQTPCTAHDASLKAGLGSRQSLERQTSTLQVQSCLRTRAVAICASHWDMCPGKGCRKERIWIYEVVSLLQCLHQISTCTVCPSQHPCHLDSHSKIASCQLRSMIRSTFDLTSRASERQRQYGESVHLQYNPNCSKSIHKYQ